jgi:16S rRNA (adenine1518-N6/adenine1519-N6)-dimethyltransferase
MPQTKRQIEALLAAAGFHPLKRFGQHFLIDGNLMHKLVAGADIRRDDVVLEVGPGTGSLTELLLEAAGHVVAVEIDNGLQAVCRDRLGDSGRLTLIHTDVLQRKSAVADSVVEALKVQAEALGGRMMMVANLPYQVATPLIVDLLLGGMHVSPLCFTVQAEVADRMVAPAGGKAYGPVSVFVQALADIEQIARVPPQAFWPVPKVDSAMLRLDVREGRASSPPVREELAELVHGCFLHRRKTMKSNLKGLLGTAASRRVEDDGRWNLDDRPERITVTQWVELAEFVTRG